MSAGTNLAARVVGCTDSLLCPICLDLLQAPRQCINGHACCHNCLLDALDQNAECPSCRAAMTMATAARNLQLETMLQEVQVRCGHDSCGVVVRLSGLPLHEAKCGYQVVTCVCGKAMPLHEVPRHFESDCEAHLWRHEARCGYQVVTCVCGVRLPLHEISRHFDAGCAAHRWQERAQQVEREYICMCGSRVALHDLPRHLGVECAARRWQERAMGIEEERKQHREALGHLRRQFHVMASQLGTFQEGIVAQIKDIARNVESFQEGMAMALQHMDTKLMQMDCETGWWRLLWGVCMGAVLEDW